MFALLRALLARSRRRRIVLGLLIFLATAVCMAVRGAANIADPPTRDTFPKHRRSRLPTRRRPERRPAEGARPSLRRLRPTLEPSHSAESILRPPIGSGPQPTSSRIMSRSYPANWSSSMNSPGLGACRMFNHLHSSPRAAAQRPHCLLYERQPPRAGGRGLAESIPAERAPARGRLPPCTARVPVLCATPRPTFERSAGHSTYRLNIVRRTLLCRSPAASRSSWSNDPQPTSSRFIPCAWPAENVANGASGSSGSMSIAIAELEALYLRGGSRRDKAVGSSA